MEGSPILPIDELGVEYPSFDSPGIIGCDRILRKYVELLTAIGAGYDLPVPMECVLRNESMVLEVTTLDLDCVDRLDSDDSTDS